MTAGSTVCRHAADSSLAPEESGVGAEGWRTRVEPEGETATLHERLVAYVHTLSNGSRRGVWSEHSYARSRSARCLPAPGGGGGGGDSGGRVRVLLAPPALEPAPAEIDVCTPPSPARSPPAGDDPHDEDSTETETETEVDAEGEEDEAWEERVAVAAPTAAAARAARAALEAVRRMRLARAAARGARERREAARAAARRLRLALAPLWGGGGARWVHAALTAHMPRGPRRLYDAAVAELRRARPRLAELLGAGAGTGPRCTPPSSPPAVGPDSSPWLVWVSSGVAELDARWERQLGALVHTRVVRGALGDGGALGGEAAPPEQWCAAAAGAVRAALTDALAEAGSRSVVLGGVGAGAGAALALARGAGGAGRAEGGVRGLVAVAPPLLTAEGARDAPDDALRHVRLPLLLVVPTGAPDCARHVANNICEGGAGAGGGASARRVLEVRGADASLRVGARVRRRRGITQRALDAALLEECVRWAVEVSEQEESDTHPGGAPAGPAGGARRHALPSIVREIDLTEEEYSHLPPAAPTSPSPPPAAPPQNARPLEIVEGRVVSRGSGSTPLALLPPPRRAAPAPAAGVGAGALAAADIMQLPIVFADDEAGPGARPPPAPPAERGAGAGSGVTVTSGKSKGLQGAGALTIGDGSVKFTRVILAKRGARGAGASRGVGAGARRLVLRRGVRLVTRSGRGGR